VVSGTGKPLRRSEDLAKLFIWQLREYDDVEPVIQSVGEDEEVSIKEVADTIAKAVGFKGDYTFRKPASNKKLLSLTGDFKTTPFEGAEDERILLLEAARVSPSP